MYPNLILQILIHTPMLHPWAIEVLRIRPQTKENKETRGFYTRPEVFRLCITIPEVWKHTRRIVRVWKLRVYIYNIHQELVAMFQQIRVPISGSSFPYQTQGHGLQTEKNRRQYVLKKWNRYLHKGLCGSETTFRCAKIWRSFSKTILRCSMGLLHNFADCRTRQRLEHPPDTSFYLSKVLRFQTVCSVEVK